jgi:hypothetical protein
MPARQQAKEIATARQVLPTKTATRAPSAMPSSSTRRFATLAVQFSNVRYDSSTRSPRSSS